MKRSNSLPTGAAILLTFVVTSTAGNASEPASKTSGDRDRPRIGDKIEPITFKDIRYLPRSLADLVSKKDAVPTRAFVLVFTTTSCPLVQKYLPRLQQLERQYRQRGVKFLAVNVDAADTIVEMAAQAVKSAAEFPFVKDFDGNCVRACGVERTPESVLIDTDYRLRYRGRIDNQYRLGGTRPEATQSELRDAIEALLAGGEPEIPETPVDGCRITLPAARTPSGDFTFYEHVSPLLQKHCRHCHQPGTAAPFALVSYDDVVARAETIAEVVAERRMPPWFASGEFGSFANCRALADRDREIILSWLAGDKARGKQPAREPGNPVEEPRPNSEGKRVSAAEPTWLMGKPDLVVAGPGTYSIPAEGYVDYKYALLPFVFLQDTWIQGAELLPDNPRVVHHCNVGFVSLGDGVRNAKLVTGYLPGGGPLLLDSGVAIKIPRGAMLGWQLHLTTTGKPETCRLRLGFRFARERVQKELRYLQLSNESFTIPPGAPSHPVAQSRTIDRDITAFGLFAHMHVRGKDITFRAFSPDRDPETMLMVPNYDFNWQMGYQLPIGQKRYPTGTRFECLAHFDNSSFNPYNPDPSATVRVGEQTSSEMMFGFVFYTDDAEQLNLAVDPKPATGKIDRPGARGLLSTEGLPCF